MADGSTPEGSIPVTHRNFVYALKLTARQHHAMDGLLEQQRLLYNAALQERCDAWAKARRSITYIDQCKSLTQIRADDGVGYGSLPLNLSRGTLAKLDRAFQAFYRRCKRGETPGFPRFKPMSRWDSLTFKEMSGLRIRSEGRRLSFAGLPGSLRVRCHRPFPEASVPKSATFTRTATGWHVSLLLAVPMLQAAEWRPIELDERPDVGLDLGIEAFAMDSEGRVIPSPHRPMDRQRRRLQRALSRKKRGSRRRQQAKARLAKLSGTESAARKHHAHVQSYRLAKAFRVMAVEDLSIGNMTRSAKGTSEAPGSNVEQKAGLNKAILHQGWSDFLFKLSYKAESAGGRVVSIKPHGTSQDCSGCGVKVPKRLSERRHLCPQCGLDLHRDHNAARNILLRAAREDKIPARLQPSGFSTAVPRESRLQRA